ncbi:MAG TPA: hypothetical protein VND01_00535 [Candidatus Acidoferrales bacterium]|nr:hypothetical protein [Candidatus Acidoferrales bacterium]
MDKGLKTMDNEEYEEIAEIVKAGLESGTSMQIIKECIGQVTLRRWVLELPKRTQRKQNLIPLRRK